MAVEIKVLQKPLFGTSDGKEFSDEGEAKRHEVELRVEALFPSFAAASGYALKAFTCLVTWELHKEGLLPPRKNGKAPEAPEPVTPAAPRVDGPQD